MTEGTRDNAKEKERDSGRRRMILSEIKDLWHGLYKLL